MSRVSATVLAFALLASLSLASLSLCADEGRPEAPTAGSTAIKLELADLPDPPPTLAKLMEQGSVEFFVGQRPGPRQGRRLSAETHFQMSFDYRSRTQWRIHRSDGQAKLVITAGFQNIALNQTHEVWFQRRPGSADFWSNPLVLHEFDHIRLSCDPGLQQRFARRLRDNNVITQQLASKVRVTDAMVRRAVDKHVKRVFDETVDLVNIRYQELDRQTRHGLQPLPEDSSLSELLR